MYLFLNTDLLSQNMSVGPSSGTTNMSSLYRNAITNSTASLSAVNLDMKFDILTELFFLLSHITGDWLQNINIPVCYRLVTLSDA